MGSAGGLAVSLWANPRLSRGRLLDFQQRLLRRRMTQAFGRVPFWRERFAAAGLGPGDIRDATDLRSLPLTSRREIQDQAPDRLLDTALPRRSLLSATTTGSTGEPLRLYRSRGDLFLFFLIRARIMRSYGLRPTDLMARIDPRGRQGMPRAWRLVQGLGLYRAHAIHILEEPPRIARLVRELRPQVLTGDSGVLTRVSREFEGLPLNRPRLRFLVAGSEVLTRNMRLQIEEVFGRPVYDTYAAEEFSVIAWECPETGLYHVADDSLVLEVLRDGRPVGPGEEGEAVVTGLLFGAMPLIRYRLGDEVRRGPEPCPCGAPFSTLEGIRGRMTDYLSLPGGRDLYAASVAYVFQRCVDWIRQYQVVQEREDLVRIRAVARGRPRRAEVDGLSRDLDELLGPDVTVRLEFVDEIRPGRGGKHRIFRSRVGSPYDEAQVRADGGRSRGRAPGLSRPIPPRT
jgi:phenylacetate-CoA ligase